MGSSHSNNSSFVSEINVTPFVDVMLVLLIIFMVTAPMMAEGLDVELPTAQAVEVLPTDSNNVVLTVQKDGSMFLDEYPTDLTLLKGQLNATVKAQNKQLFLQADKDVPYGIVVDVMGQVRSAGIDNMGIVAERQSTPSSQIKPVTKAVNTPQ